MTNRLWTKAALPLFSLLLIIFLISVFKNIAFPLLWQDEAETTIAGQHVIAYGFPKVHDNKNTLYLFELADKTLAVKEPYDAYISPSWGSFYFAALGVKLAELTNNIYTKTALMRIPFALIGLWGIFIIAQIGAALFKEKKPALWALLSGFVLLNLLSISLTLHLREVRYYSIAIFIAAAAIGNYLKFHHFLAPTKSSPKLWWYTLKTVILLNLALLTFPPLFFILLISFGTIESWYILQQPKPISLKKLWPPALPFVLTLIASIPIFSFFEIIPIANAISQFAGFNLATYQYHLIRTFDFLFSFEFLGLAMFFKVAALITWRFNQKTPKTSFEQQIMRVSTFVATFIVIYVLIICRTPYLFERYLMVIIPFLNLMLLLDLTLTIIAIQNTMAKHERDDLTFIFIAITLAIIIPTTAAKTGSLRGHVYELFHQYQGPLDYVIPYIKDSFDHPEDLVIATNYEELSYAYYLNSKVTIGYVGNNLAEDSQIQPDIIVMRKRRDNFIPVFETLLKQDHYTQISFPIYDYDFNNIPELYLPHPHLFKTKFTPNQDDQLTIYVRTKLMQK